MPKNTSFIVVNGTESDVMTDVYVVHEGDFVVAKAAKLGPGEATAPLLFISDGENDYWDIYFRIRDNVYQRFQKECGLKEEDSEQVTVISLYERNFSIAIPQSSGCYSNTYWSGTNTVARMTVVNQSLRSVRTRIDSQMKMNANLYYFDGLHLAKRKSSGCIHLQTGGIVGQSSFGIGLDLESSEELDLSLQAPSNGTVNFDLGTQPYDSMVNKTQGSPVFAGFVAADAPLGSGPSFDMFVYVGQNILPPILNSTIDANLPAIQAAVNKGNVYKLKITNDIWIDISHLSGLDKVSCTYATAWKTESGLKFTAILVNSEKLSIDANIHVMGKEESLSGAYLKHLQILIEGDFSIDLKTLKPNVCISNLKVYFSDYEIDLSTLAILFPRIRLLLKILESTALTSPNFAGAINTNTILSQATHLNENLINALNSALQNQNMNDGNCS